MKILLIDILSPNGHVNYNRGLLRALNNRGYSITFCSEKIMLEKVCCGFNIKTQIIPDTLFHLDLSSLYKRIIRPFKWRYLLIKWYFSNAMYINKFDYVLFTSAEPFVISFISRFIKVRCGFIDHGIGKIAESKLYKISYKYLLGDNIDIITLDDYINLFVESLLKRPSHVIYHPIYESEQSKSTHNPVENIIFAPSGGNDQEFIKELLLKKDSIPNKFKIIIRTSGDSFESDRLVIYNKSLPSEVYYKYMNTSAAILIPYEKTYNYRTSAIFFEAMANNKPVIILNNNTLAQIVLKHSKVAFLIDSVEDLDKAFNLTRNIKAQEFKNVLEQYSDEIIHYQFLKLCQSTCQKL